MARICYITGKKTGFGHNVSKSRRRTNRQFKCNLHWKKFTLANGQKIRLRVSRKGLKIIDKFGVDHCIT